MITAKFKINLRNAMTNDTATQKIEIRVTDYIDAWTQATQKAIQIKKDYATGDTTFNSYWYIESINYIYPC